MSRRSSSDRVAGSWNRGPPAGSTEPADRDPHPEKYSQPSRKPPAEERAKDKERPSSSQPWFWRLRVQSPFFWNPDSLNPETQTLNKGFPGANLGTRDLTKGLVPLPETCAGLVLQYPGLEANFEVLGKPCQAPKS